MDDQKGILKNNMIFLVVYNPFISISGIIKEITDKDLWLQEIPQEEFAVDVDGVTNVIF